MRHGEPNHTCRICGQPYFACDTCDAKIGKTWRAVTCTAEHYAVYFALWQYSQGQMEEDEIKRILSEAGANQWKNSPSLDLIESLIGEYVEEEPEAEEQEVAEPVAESAEEAIAEGEDSGEAESVVVEVNTPQTYGNNRQNNYGSYRHKKRRH